MDALPERTPLRLKGYDYSKEGFYFITICTQNHRNVLWLAPVGANCVRPPLSPIGELVEKEIAVLSTVYERLSVDKYVIMPNHIHLLLVIDSSVGRTQFAPTISRAVKQFKGSITKQIGCAIWQRGYNDHIIRDERDYLARWQYIDNNPAKWAEDEYYFDYPGVKGAAL
jgi:REP element-mobilizing transposase RayT